MMNTSGFGAPSASEPQSRQAPLPPGELLVTQQPESADVVVALKGELDLDTAPKLRSVLSEILDDGTRASLTLDVADLEFIDSTGLRVLVDAVSRLGDRGGELVVRRPRPSTLKVLQICGLTESIRIATG